MGRPSNTEQRRSEIIQALLEVMAEKGYDGASIKAIAQQAQLTPGLIHYHFKTKQDILTALIAWITEAGMQRLALPPESEASPWQRLEHFIRARLAKDDSASPALVRAWVMIAAESIRQPELRERYQALIEAQLVALRGLLSAVWGRPENDVEVVQLSGIVLAAMEGAFQLSTTAGEVMPVNYAADALLALIASRIQSEQ